MDPKAVRSATAPGTSNQEWDHDAKTIQWFGQSRRPGAWFALSLTVLPASVLAQASPWLTGANSLVDNLQAWAAPIAVLAIMFLAFLAMASRIVLGRGAVGDGGHCVALWCAAGRGLGARHVCGLSHDGRLTRNAGLWADVLFIGLTRPPMRWGVSYTALLVNLVCVMEAVCADRSSF